MSSLQQLVRQIRFKIIEMSHRGEAPHLACSLSCVDIVATAYEKFLRIDPKNPLDPNRDRFILSKGHAISTHYATLAMKGFFSVDQLSDFNQDGSCLPEHPTPRCVPGVELATGSLGHGLPVGIGLALAAKIRQEKYRVMVVMGDGECNEGSVWEAAMFAPMHQLDNLIVVIDFNKWQATGRSEQILGLSPLRQKWEAFGWDAYEIDGHNLSEITEAYNKVPSSRGKPIAIIAHTIKGRGVSFMEDDNNWHYRIPKVEDVQKAKEELGVV